VLTDQPIKGAAYNGTTALIALYLCITTLISYSEREVIAIEKQDQQAAAAQQQNAAQSSGSAESQIRKLDNL